MSDLPSWHLSPGPDFSCSECGGEVEVMFVMLVPERVSAMCKKCEASRVFQLTDDYFDRPRLDQIQFVNLIPKDQT